MSINKWIVIAVTVSAFGCGKEAPPPPQFSLAEAEATLSSLKLDEAFFKTLEEVRNHSSSDQAAYETFVRYKIEALATAVVQNNTWALKRLLGSEPSIGQTLSALASELKNRPDIAAALNAVGGLYGGSSTGDVGKAIEASMGNGGPMPGLRLLLANALAQALKLAADLPETERGLEITRRLPGFPNPMTKNPSETAFPSALRALARLLQATPAGGLGVATKKLAEDIEAALGDRLFPITVGTGVVDRAALVAISGGYIPLTALSVTGEGIRVGSRPVFTWNKGNPLDRAQAFSWPGEVVLKDVDAVEVPQGATETITKIIADASAIEAEAYRSMAGHGVLNAEREGHPKAVLVDIGDDMRSSALKTALGAASTAGVGDFRLLVSGGPGRILPVFYRVVPKLKDVEMPKGPRILTVIGPDFVDLYVPPKAAAKLPLTGWPAGVRVVADNKKFFKLSLATTRTPETGFAGKVTAAIGALAKAISAGPFVDVVVMRLKDLEATAIKDLVEEIAAAEGPAFDKIGAFFPGIECQAGQRCPAFVPVLFSEAQIPKPQKPEATVTETRPAGFCEKAAVQRVMMGRSGAYRACYEMELQRHPELAGRVELRFTIEPDGSVSGITVTHDDLGSQTVTNCLIKQVSGLIFPKPDGGVCVIRWPFKFQPGG